MKELLKRLKTAYQVLTGKARFAQRTISIQDIDKRLETLLSKYTDDKYRSVRVELVSNGEYYYRLYTNAFGGLSGHNYLNNLEDAFKVFENELKQATNGTDKQEAEKLTIEI